MRHPKVPVAAIVAASLLLGGAACGTSPAGQAAQHGAAPLAQPVDRQLRDLERAFDGRIGAYALDTGTGRTITYRGAERFPLLSTFKAMAAAAILHKARTSDPGLLDRRMFWTADEVKPNSPVTKEHVKDGLTAAELCEAAITVSDNTAGNMLLKQLGGPAGLTRYLRTLGDPRTRLDRWETELNVWNPREKRDTTSPRFIGGDLTKVTVGHALTAPDRARLIGWLRATKTGDERIRKGLPKDWTVGDKTGTADAYGGANDIAVVWPPNSAPLIIAVYTHRNDPKGASDSATIAKTATILARGLGKLS